jgi:hypothetical protein
VPDVSPYPPEKPDTPRPDELAELMKLHLLLTKHANPFLRSLIYRIEALEAVVRLQHKYNAEIDTVLMRIRDDYQSQTH